MKERIKKVIKITGLLLFIGLVYTGFVKVFHIAIPCIFRELTGFYCPGCGITTMCLALLRFDFTSAFYANPVIFVMLPILAVLAVIGIIRYIKYDNTNISKIERIMITIMIIILVVFAVIRNLPFYNNYI